jgi:hypothetical protein
MVKRKANYHFRNSKKKYFDFSIIKPLKSKWRVVVTSDEKYKRVVSTYPELFAHVPDEHLRELIDRGIRENKKLLILKNRCAYSVVLQGEQFPQGYSEIASL